MSKPIPHGTYNGYKNYGCRCERCCKANTRYCKAWMDAHPEAKERRAGARRLKNRGGNPDVLRVTPAIHGELSGINKHKRDKTPLCRKCSVLATRLRKESEAARKAARRPHGTEAALRRHYVRRSE